MYRTRSCAQHEMTRWYRDPPQYIIVRLCAATPAPISSNRSARPSSQSHQPVWSTGLSEMGMEDRWVD